MKPYRNTRLDFYQEREWRFIPKGLNLVFEKDNLTATREQLNADYDASGRDYIKFSVDDISHIVVPSRSEVHTMMEVINLLNFTMLDKLMLIQRITDLKSIEKDF